jgi:hypothetical protein
VNTEYPELKQNEKKFWLEKKKEYIEAILEIGKVYFAAPIDDWNRIRHDKQMMFVFCGIELDMHLIPVHGLPGMMRVLTSDEDFWIELAKTVVIYDFLTGKEILVI